MMNPVYYFATLRSNITNDYKPSRELSLVLTKLDEAELWLTKSFPTEEAINRDQASV